jgi:hypothetical protein
VLQNKPTGLISRVPAAEIEALVIEAVRYHLHTSEGAAPSIPDNAHELIERHVERVTLTAKHIDVQWRHGSEAPVGIDVSGAAGNSISGANFGAADDCYPVDSPRPDSR